MGEKVMVDFPGFITRDSRTRHLLVGDDTHVLLSMTILSELYRRLFTSLGFDETAKIIYESTKKGTFEVQKNLIKAYRVSIKTNEDLSKRISRISASIQTYGHGRGSMVKTNKEFIFQVRNSVVAEALKDSGWNRPVCYFIAGFFAGMADAFGELHKPPISYDCIETKCIASGAAYCEFKLVPQKAGKALTK